LKGADVANVSFSQTNTKGFIFETISFGTINLTEGTVDMSVTPKTDMTGTANVTVLLTYKKDDTIKYKARAFNIDIISNPSMIVDSAVTAQVNMPKFYIKIKAATNGVGGASNLTLDVTTDNPDLLTSLTANPVESDGTSKISFVPAQDECGTGTITATLTNSTTQRDAEYVIEVSVLDGDGNCGELALENNSVDIQIAPNPASEKVEVSFSQANGATIAIVDLTGRKVMTQVVQPGQDKAVLNISKLSAGIYFIVVEGTQTVKKLIVK
jgi:hypothetical protein